MSSENESVEPDQVVTLSGELTILRAEELKVTLRELLQEHERLQVRFSDVSAVDLACLQLLCSAHRTAHSLGKSFTIGGGVPPMVRMVMKQAGFTRQKGCAFSPDTNCLGCEGE